jgi:hypothetical protein
MTAYNPEAFNQQAEPRTVASEQWGVAPTQVVTVKGMDDPARGPFVVGVMIDGQMVPVGNDVSADQFRERLLAGDAAPADAASSAPESAGDIVPTAPVAAAPLTGGTTSDNLVDVGVLPATGSGNRGSGGNAGGGDTWETSRPSRQTYDTTSGQDDTWSFTPEDFLDIADGDRAQATRMAKQANKRRRSRRSRGTTSSGMFGAGFPFTRPSSTVRDFVLAALNESMNGRKRR